MSELILNNDFEIFFTNEGAGNGDKQIRWVGSGSNTYTVNELYSAIQNIFDDNTAGVGDYMDEGIPMSASTPTQYAIGEVETNDNEPWFIDPASVNHLTSGAIETTSWERTPLAGTGTIGIVRVQCSGAGFNWTSSDIGDGCTDATNNDSGTILYVDTVNFQVWIRPDDNTAANNFDTGSGNITADTSTNTVTYASAATSGEIIWTNLFTIGNIVANTRLYVYQNFSKITNFWGDGHFDRLFITSDGFNATPGLIDDGLLTVFARQYGKLYDHSIVDASNGGRIPVALSTSTDSNNTTGYSLVNCSGGSGTFTDGEVIGNNATQSSATALAVITNVAGTGADPDLTVYYIGDLTSFTGTDTVFSYATSAQADVDTVSDSGPAALSTNPTFVFGADTDKDIGDGEGVQPYDVHINVQGNTLSDFYEYTKYITRRGEDEPLLTNYGREGEQYITVGELRIPYDDQTANFTEGAILTGQTSGATGVVVADHDDGATGTLIVKEVRGTFDDTTPEEIRDDGTPGIANIVSGGLEDTLVSRIAPFGTFAGGQFFGARGVWITNMHANDANNYSLIDSNGEPRTPPASVSVSVNGLVSGDRVAVFRATGDNNTVDKSIFSIQQTHTSPVTYIRVSESIPSDTPSSGTIRVVRRDGSGNILGEERYSYSDWNNDNQPTYSQFNLSESTTNDYDTDDTAYAPFIDEQSTGTSVSESVQYVTDRFVTTRVRRKGILPFTVKGTLNSSGYSATAIRTEDNIVD